MHIRTCVRTSVEVAPIEPRSRDQDAKIIVRAHDWEAIHGKAQYWRGAVCADIGPPADCVCRVGVVQKAISCAGYSASQIKQ